jgi:hypothetical protein
MRLHDACMLGRLGVVAYQHFFVKLFSGAQASHSEFNVAIRVQPSRNIMPDNSTISLARSMILTDCIISSTNTSPPCPIAPASVGVNLSSDQGGCVKSHQLWRCFQKLPENRLH